MEPKGDREHRTFNLYHARWMSGIFDKGEAANVYKIGGRSPGDNQRATSTALVGNIGPTNASASQCNGLTRNRDRRGPSAIPRWHYDSIARCS